MFTLTLIICSFVLIATALPLINSGIWWIRIFDFPRIQISIVTIFAIILVLIDLDLSPVYKVGLLLSLAITLIYQIKYVIVYTPIYKTRAKKSKTKEAKNSFTLLVSNVRMDNEDKIRFPALVNKIKPDLLLINEPNSAWAKALNSLDKDFPYAIKYPLENTYGMMLLSKLPLSQSKVNFLVKDNIPSIFTKITLPSGSEIDFYGIHPEPPKPGTDTYERDTELLIIGKKIKENKNPSVVAGDLNDVGWSKTSKLFRKYSELLDPREGRGPYNTYNVFVPLFRYPLDHVFYSKEFGLTSMEKLESIGSDHFPLLIGLCFEPEKDNSEDLETADKKEEAEVEEKIDEVKKGKNT